MSSDGHSLLSQIEGLAGSLLATRRMPTHASRTSCQTWRERRPKELPPRSDWAGRVAQSRTTYCTHHKAAQRDVGTVYMCTVQHSTAQHSAEDCPDALEESKSRIIAAALAYVACRMREQSRICLVARYGVDGLVFGESQKLKGFYNL